MVILSMVLLIGVLLFAQRLIYGRYWDLRLGMRLSFSAREAFEGDRLFLQEELTNEKPLPLPWVNAKFQISRNLVFPGAENFKVSDYYYQNDLFSVGMYQRVTRRQEFICRRRGYYRIRSMELGSSNVLISDKLIKRLDCDAELTVLPRAIPFSAMEPVYRQLYGDIEIRRFTNPDPFSFRGVREYDPRDDFRLINFSATAKTGDLIVNVRGATAAQEVVLLLNVEPYVAFPNEDVLEEGIRLAASAAGEFSRQGLLVGLLSNGRDVSTKAPVRVLSGGGDTHVHGILERLARIDLAAGQGRMCELLEEVRDPEPAYLLISSNDDPDMARAFDRIRERGLRARWLIPAIASMKAQADVAGDADISRWEMRIN
ncbi:MAG: DUF58 domain-containing protein [Clostridiales bacterium]|jgi:uncharacterized protein (DUF58 family)|nr:DUF58 domain-containing protein [Clostridiales bacterium]